MEYVDNYLNRLNWYTEEACSEGNNATNRKRTMCFQPIAGLFIFLGISLLSILIRIALDFAGNLFGLAILDLIHIFFLLLGMHTCIFM